MKTYRNLQTTILITTSVVLRSLMAFVNVVNGEEGIYQTYLPLILISEHYQEPTPPPNSAPLPGENLQCNTYGNAIICATISNVTPTKYSWLTIRGQLIVNGVPQNNLRMYTTWHFKTTESYCNDGITNEDGIASCRYYISGATSGYKVNINVNIGGYSVTTWFTTQ